LSIIRYTVTILQTLTDPYRVVIDGVLAVDKKGNPKRFATVMKALSWGQRHLEKKRKDKG